MSEVSIGYITLAGSVCYL